MIVLPPFDHLRRLMGLRPLCPEHQLPMDIICMPDNGRDMAMCERCYEIYVRRVLTRWKAERESIEGRQP